MAKLHDVVLVNMRRRALDSRSIFCRLINNIGVGRFIFHVRVALFRVDNLLGRFNQRCIELPWVLRKLDKGNGRLLLDVGCTGSLLGHELLARGFQVVGLDIHDHTMRNSREAFVQANIINTGLPSETFDVILCLSTIEHVGLDVYEQDLLLENGDLLAIQEIRRLLKPDGIFVLTLPYEGGGPIRIIRGGKRGALAERRYDHQRLSKLLDKFVVVDSSFFLCLLKYRCKFVPISQSSLDMLSSKACEGSLGCLVLRKCASNMARAHAISVCGLEI